MIVVVATARAKLARAPLAERFVMGAAWSICGSVLTSGVTIVTAVLLARLLGKAVYGQFVAIQTTLSMVGVFAGVGIGAAATRFVAQLKTRDLVRLARILTLSARITLAAGLAVSLGLIFGANWISSHILNSPELIVPLRIAASAAFFTALDAYQRSVLIGFEAMRRFAVASVIGSLSGFPIMLGAAEIFGLNGAAAGFLISSMMQAGVSRYHMFREVRRFGLAHPHNGCLTELTVLGRFAVPSLLSGALATAPHWIVQAMLANTAGGYSELAVLGIAMHWFNVVMFVPNTTARVVLPILTDRIASMDKLGSRRLLSYAVGANIVAALPLALTIGMLSSSIMSAYGSEFHGDTLPLLWSVLAAVIAAAQLPMANVLTALSRMWLGALITLAWALAYITVAHVLINKGALGVMIGLALGYALYGAGTAFLSYTSLKRGSRSLAAQPSSL